jgi:hypothetical protein
MTHPARPAVLALENELLHIKRQVSDATAEVATLRDQLALYNERKDAAERCVKNTGLAKKYVYFIIWKLTPSPLSPFK